MSGLGGSIGTHMVDVSPKKVVGCRGGSRHVEEIPLFEKRKVTKFPFHVFDRSEIHIKVLEEMFTGFFTLFRCTFPEFQLFKLSKAKKRYFEFATV